MKGAHVLNIVLIIIIIILLTALIFLKLATNDAFYNFESFVQYKQINWPQNMRSSNKENILVFHSCCYKDNKLPNYAEYSTRINKLYSDKYNYDFKVIFHDVNEMPPYWLRVKDVLTLLNTTNYAYVVYLDLDAIFNDFEHSVGQLLDVTGDYDMYISQDVKVTNIFFPFNIELALTNNLLNNLLNTGCFIVKNSEWSKNFIDTWLNTCFSDGKQTDGVCKNSWKFNASKSKWECEGCKWAGVKYEQGALANLYISNVMDARKHICLYNQNVLCNTDPDTNSFVLHLLSQTDKFRAKIFKNKLNDHLKNF